MTTWIAKGARVMMHPASDAWMQGDRYGEVVGYGRKRLYRDMRTGEDTLITPLRIKLDKSGKIVREHPDEVIVI